ncbi:hypothetical protein ACFX1Q_010635 [Malus domestica]
MQRFPIINTFDLTISFRNKPSIVPFETTIRFKFHFVDPFAANETFVGRQRHEIPSVVGLKGDNFMLHGLTPLWILNNLLKTSRFFEKSKCGGEGFMARRQKTIG